LFHKSISLRTELGESFSKRRQIIRSRPTAPAKPKQGKSAKAAIKTAEE
jgi:hypothetical protein